MKSAIPSHFIKRERFHNTHRYLNNLIEQDHRFIKGRVNPGLGFSSFNTARRTISGYEAINMIRKGQIEGVGKVDIQALCRALA